MVKKNLIGKLRLFLTIAGILTMPGLCGCSPGPVMAECEEKILTEAVQEDCLQLAERDSAAPEGTLKGYFLVASEKVTPSDFVENVIDSSEFVEGFRSIRKIYDEAQVKAMLESGMKKVDITKEEPDFEKIFALNWDATKDCYEEQGNMEQSLEKNFEPVENGLYELEVVALDSYGNSSVAKVFVLYDRAVTTLSEFENYVEKLKVQTDSIQSAQKDGLDRRKAEEAFEKVNAKRIESGVHALAWDESLYELACIRAQEIVSDFSHQRPDGSYVGDVIIRQYGASGCGENIASNYKSTTNLVNGWSNSPGHKENMLNGSFDMGVMACYCHNGSYYWVNLFKQS